MSPLIKISLALSPPEKFPRPTIYRQKSVPPNPSRPGGRRLGRIFAGKLSAGGNFSRGDPIMGHWRPHQALARVTESDLTSTCPPGSTTVQSGMRGLTISVEAQHAMLDCTAPCVTSRQNVQCHSPASRFINHNTTYLARWD